MNDVAKPGIPNWALIGSDPRIAGPIAKSIDYGAGVHDDTVREGASNGFYVAMGAITLTPDGKGGERDGPLMLVDFSPTDAKHGGGMSITGSDSVRKGLFNMIDVQYAARASAFLGR